MLKIYPKTCENLIGEPALREYIKKYKGVEIQYFHKSKEKLIDFIMAPTIHKLMEIYPDLEEITVHPPLDRYNIEQILLVNRDLFYKLINELIDLSTKYNIKINMILHSNFTYEEHKWFTINELKKAADLLKGTNVKLLIENLYVFYGEGLFGGLDVCKEIDSENINICIDICHLYCRTNILKISIEEFLKEFLDAELCRKYVYQIHFADTKNNDGYRDENTHGRTYDSIDKIKYDLELLKMYGMEEKIIVTEVSEDNYSTREDQIKTIKMLEQIYKN